MADGLAKKRRIRAGHKASVTRMLNQADELSRPTEPDTRIDTSKLSRLKLSLQEKLETLKLLDGEILDLIEDEGDLAGEIEQADSFKEGIYAAMINIEKLCTSPPVTPIPSSPTPSSGTDIGASSIEPVQRNRVKLPKLTLRPFNGEITTWTTFWDSYESAIHKNPDLSDIDKFNYLRSLLERTAHEAISGLTLTSTNYHEAIAILQKRFGNKQQIISRHMDILLNIDAVPSQHNLKGLRHLYDLVESHIRSLNSLGVASSSYGSLLSSVLLNKLPQELRLIVSRKVPDDESWSLDVIMKILGEEVEARERSTASQQGRRPPRDQHTAAALLSGSTADPACCYCQQAHPSSSCQVVTRVEARKQLLKKYGRCFNCLRKGHLGRECRSSAKCEKCGGRHHNSICPKTPTKGPLTRSTSPANKAGKPDQPLTVSEQNKPATTLNPRAAPYTTTPTTSTSLYVDAKKSVLLQTARTVVYNPDAPESPLPVRIILDSGSQRSYVTRRVKNALSLKPQGELNLSIITFGSDKEDPRVCEMVRLGMRLKNGMEGELMLFVVPLICEPLTNQPITFCIEQYNHLSQLDLADPSDGEDPMEIDILIGSDYYWEFITGEILRGDSGPVAINTKLGWVLSGLATSTELHQTSVNLITSHTLKIGLGQKELGNEQLNEQLRSFWELESLGIKNPDQSVYEDFERNIHFKNGRYEVTLPWKNAHPMLPDNYHLSLKRLQGLLRRLRQTPDILKEYDDIIRTQLSQQIIEVVENPECSDGERVHYLPHHAVIRQDKETTKLRVVYDASAKSEGPSLNECLYAGPKFDQRIMDILLRFRTHRVALTADIERAFLMISMLEGDRDALRFLWVDDINQDEPRIIVLRFARVVFGVSSSPFLLNATMRHHMEKYSSSHSELVQTLSRSIYVDDIICGAKDEDQAYRLYVESKGILRSGGFNLRKFVTNVSLLQEKINQNEGMLGVEAQGARKQNPDEETYAKSTLGNALKMSSGEQKVLGMRWNVVADSIVFKLDDVARLAIELEPTKRHVISIIGRFYDPIGFLSPVVIRFKMLFQELCESRMDWDEMLSGSLLKKWNLLTSELQESQQVSLPRCYFSKMQAVKSCRLIGFCDASVSAYAAVVYLLIDADTDQAVKFVSSKTRVAPVQGQSIPRLELLSALLLARLISSVTHSLEVEVLLMQPKCFTDSKVALYWICGLHKEWKPFVQNRVNEIRQLLPVGCWSHCSGRDNPADIPSRGLSPLNLSINKLWRNGPDWLKDMRLHDMPHNPQLPIKSMPEECVTEMKAKDQRLVHNLLVSEASPGVGKIMRCEDYSTLSRLLRVTSRLLQFLEVLKSQTKASGTAADNALTSTDPILQTESISKAEILWIIESQVLLTKDNKFEMWKKQFGLFLDGSGIWRCGGRLSNASLSFSTQHPILLHKDHHLTKLIIRRAHSRVLHNGVKETLTELRSKYWIIRGRSLIRSVIHQCFVCRRFEGAPHQAPLPPPLPTFRVKEEPPFTYTGVDFAGPLYIKTSTIDSVSKDSKVWICLYTCCVVRAVHLDLIPDMSTSTFIRSLKRFAARRGLPKMFISDNGKTFKAAAKLIEAMMKHEDIQEYLSGVRVKWSFNIERAPWWGGVFERLIRSMKRCLRKMIGKARFSHDELLTAITEVEMIINSRPLTYQSADDMQEPLTPSHLLIGRRLLNLPDNLYGEAADDDVDVTPAYLSRRMKYLNTMLDQFWKRWRNEYLLELRESHRYCKGSIVPSPISVGDVVVVYCENQPRGFWKLARVEDIIAGQDGKIRGAVVRVHTKGNRTTLLRRPLQHLYPVEVNCQTQTLEDNQDKEVDDNSSNTNEDASTTEPPVPRRSNRAAATRANDRLMACMYEFNS